MIGTLGRSLGVSLFGRTVHGLSLTADGSRYLESCQPVLEQLAAADEALRGAAVRPRGTLVVGTSPIISQHCILPALPLFHARYPDIQIDVRNVDRPTSLDASAAERSEEHTSELQSLMRISYAVFYVKKNNSTNY